MWISGRGVPGSTAFPYSSALPFPGFTTWKTPLCRRFEKNEKTRAGVATRAFQKNGGDSAARASTGRLDFLDLYRRVMTQRNSAVNRSGV